MTQTVAAPAVGEIRAAAERCLDFLASHFEPNGRHRTMPDNPSVHYKAVYVFNYGGRRELALRALEYIESELLDADGGYRNKALVGPGTGFLYEAGWLAWGAAALGRFDLARRVAKRVQAEQDAHWGGFWNDNELGHVQYSLNSSSAAAGCAAAGEVAAAEACSRMLGRLLDRQPELDKGFYFSLSAAGEPVKSLGDRPAYHFYDYQGWAHPSMFATVLAALVWTGRQTGNPAHYALARRYADVMLRHHAPQRMPFTSKSGWAALQLYAHQPDADLLTYATRICRHLLELQMPNGGIDVSSFPGMERGVPPATTQGTTYDWVLTALAVANGAG